MNWFLLLLPTAVSMVAAGWLNRRRYRRDDDTIYTTAPAWLLPAVTALGTLLAAAFYVGRPPLEVLTYGLALVWGALLAFIDLDVRRLPDVLTLPAYPVTAVLLAACSATSGDWTALARAAACAGMAVALFLAIALLGPGSSGLGSSGLGLGDVKLVGVLAGLLGWHGWSVALFGLLAGCVIAGLQAMVLLIARRADRHTFLAYGPALIAGSFLAGALAPIL